MGKLFVILRKPVFERREVLRVGETGGETQAGNRAQILTSGLIRA